METNKIVSELRSSREAALIAHAEQLDIARGLLAEATAYLPIGCNVFTKIMQFFQDNP